MEICQKCSSLGPTCCEKRRDILLTEGDVRRIGAPRGIEPIFEYRVPSDPAYLDQEDDPNWNRYTVRPDGTRRVLRHGPSGACILFTGAGCAIAEDCRPLVCRLYPYRYNERDLAGTETECPAHLLNNGQSILEALGMTEKAARKWWDLLYRELRNGGGP